jgi:flagellar protein FlbD
MPSTSYTNAPARNGCLIVSGQAADSPYVERRVLAHSVWPPRIQSDEKPMINLTRLNNQPLVVNADLIKFIENAPDTVITLLTGEKLVVRESAQEVLDRIHEFHLRSHRRIGAGITGKPRSSEDARSSMERDKPLKSSEDEKL